MVEKFLIHILAVHKYYYLLPDMHIDIHFDSPHFHNFLHNKVLLDIVLGIDNKDNYQHIDNVVFFFDIFFFDNLDKDVDVDVYEYNYYLYNYYHNYIVLFVIDFEFYYDILLLFCLINFLISLFFCSCVRIGFGISIMTISC